MTEGDKNKLEVLIWRLELEFSKEVIIAQKRIIDAESMKTKTQEIQAWAYPKNYMC